MAKQIAVSEGSRRPIGHVEHHVNWKFDFGGQWQHDMYIFHPEIRGMNIYMLDLYVIMHKQTFGCFQKMLILWVALNSNTNYFAAQIQLNSGGQMSSQILMALQNSIIRTWLDLHRKIIRVRARVRVRVPPHPNPVTFWWAKHDLNCSENPVKSWWTSSIERAHR